MRIDKLLAIAAFIFITLALTVIAATSPATGYELTIYHAYPSSFWFFIIASSACGICILIHQAFAAEKSHWWLAGLFVVIFANSTFLALPFFRGYVFYPKGDAMTHVGLMKDIIATGHIGSGNFYPAVHILGVSLLDITGLSHGTVANLLFISWSLVYLLGMYLLATVVAKHRGQVLLITAFASPLVFSFLHTLLHPSVLSLFMVPLLLYFYHRRLRIPSERAATTLLLILLAFSITFTHPATCLFAIAVLLGLNLSSFLYRQVINRKELSSQSSTVLAGSYNVALIMFITFCTWYFSYAFIQKSLKRVYDFLVHLSETSPAMEPIRILAMAGITASQIVELFIYRYGPIFIYALVAIVAVIMVLRTSLNKKAQFEPINFTYAIQFIVAGLVAALYFWIPAGEIEPTRISRYFLMMAPIVSGLVIYESITRGYQKQFNLDRLKPRGKALIAVTIILIFAVDVLSIFNVYGSPRIVEANWQLSRMEIAGSEWFSSHRDTNIGIATDGVTLGRYDDFNFGVETSPLQRASTYPEQIPSHFGYDENNSIAETFDFNDRYLLTSEAGRIYVMVIPENIRYKAHQYTEEDFAKLGADPAAAHIYDNSEFEVWRVYGEQSNAGQTGTN